MFSILVAPMQFTLPMVMWVPLLVACAVAWTVAGREVRRVPIVPATTVALVVWAIFAVIIWDCGWLLEWICLL